MTATSKKANSAATTLQGPAHAPPNAKLSTILEQNSNFKLVKTFVAPGADPDATASRTKAKARTSSLVNNGPQAPQEVQAAFTIDGKLVQQQRKPRSKDSALQQRQHR